MKQASIQINSVENGYTIAVSAQHESSEKGRPVRVMSRHLVATSDADAKAQLHDVVKAMFDAPKEPKEAAAAKKG